LKEQSIVPGNWYETLRINPRKLGERAGEADSTAPFETPRIRVEIRLERHFGDWMALRKRVKPSAEEAQFT